MVFLWAVLLAVIQGLTEFLPVSSSGHLALAQAYLKMEADLGDVVAFDVALHLGTLIPVLIFYREDIKQLIQGGVHGQPGTRREIGFLMLATVVTGAIGLGLREPLEGVFGQPRIVGFALLITGVLLLTTRFRPEDGTRAWTIGLVVLIGLVQGLAITPGISRSGSTIAIALLAGVGRRDAARFSFLISVPAIFGAALLEITDLEADFAVAPALVGLVVAALVGYVALDWLVRIIDRGKIWVFAPYVMILGCLAVMIGAP